MRKPWPAKRKRIKLGVGSVIEKAGELEKKVETKLKRKKTKAKVKKTKLKKKKENFVDFVQRLTSPEEIKV